MTMEAEWTTVCHGEVVGVAVIFHAIRIQITIDVGLPSKVA